MVLHKKIRFLRLNKGWSQEIMADKLEMSPNGYGSIERGETDVQISRILQIAKLFEVNVYDLFQELERENAFNSKRGHNIEIRNNENSRCYFGETEKKANQCQSVRQQLEFNVEKQIVIIEQQEKEEN